MNASRLLNAAIGGYLFSGLPNLWGPRPTAALPLANAATVLVVATRAVLMLRRGEADELAIPR